MGRSISFDLDGATDAAMRRFWTGGYAATSLQDLLAATGLGAGSFYNTLKSKKHIFLTALGRYSETEVKKRLDALAGEPTVGQGLRAMYRLSFDALDEPDTPSRLCLMAGLLTPEVLADADMRQIAEDGQRNFRRLLTGLIERDVASGILTSGIDAETIASVIATYGQGLIRMALVDYDRERMERETELFLSALGL